MEDTFHWPHAPDHRLDAGGIFMVTTGTYNKTPHFSDKTRLSNLCSGLLKYAKKHTWQLEAWAIFPNHYHFIARSPYESADTLADFLREFHSRSARWINELDQTPARKIWHNYWETRLSYHKSYMTRLNYVHQNAVKHGLVNVANRYPWCSAAWFERVAKPSQIKTVYNYKTDRITVEDDY